MHNNKTIKNLPASERPYEKFLSLGASGLSDADLLAITIQLKAIAELSLRIAKTKKVQSIRMNNPQTIADYYMEQMRHLTNEVVICAYFDVKSRFLGDKFISKGSLSSSVVDIGSIIRTALDKNASKLVLLHNHPSGDCTPSRNDIAVTDRLIEGSGIFSIELCDHIIIGDNEYYSFYENKLI